MSTASSLSNIVISLRRQKWVASVKSLIPRSIREWGWRVASTQDVLTVQGSRMRVPEYARNAFYINDEYEPEVTAKLRALLKPGMTFCDVGANLGVMTLLAARLVGPGGRVFSFEPFPENAAILRENVAMNGFKNVTVVEAAVSERNGEAELHLSNFCGCHSLADKAMAESGNKITVKTVRLDSVSGLDRIDLLKTDTEGTELSVLRSLGALRPDNVILEANTDYFEVLGRPSPNSPDQGFCAHCVRNSDSR